MGTYLYSAIQIFDVGDEFCNPHWLTIAYFEHWKDYAVSLKLEELKGHVKYDKTFPRKSEDKHRFQIFDAIELPMPSEFDERVGDAYIALNAAALAFLNKTNRVIFWRDQ